GRHDGHPCRRLLTTWSAAGARAPAADVGPGQSETPTSTVSGTSVTPNRSRTPSLTARASATTSSALAPPRLVIARVCLVDSRAGLCSPARPKPFAKPARSMSQAALVFTRAGSTAPRLGPVVVSGVDDRTG